MEILNKDMCGKEENAQSSRPQPGLVIGSTAESTLPSAFRDKQLFNLLWLQCWETEQDLKLFSINHRRKSILSEHMAEFSPDHRARKNSYVNLLLAIIRLQIKCLALPNTKK